MHFGNKKDSSSTAFGGRVLIGEGQNHMMGLFDTVMIKDNHTCVVRGVSNALKSIDLYLKNNNLQMGVKEVTIWVMLIRRSSNLETKSHKQQVDNDIPFVSFGDFDSPSCDDGEDSIDNNEPDDISYKSSYSEKVQSKVTYKDKLPTTKRYESEDSFGEPASSVVHTFCHSCSIP
nr:nicotinate-nucleotide pyrophosphorylase [carboxylating], chloroplastic [Tanacetum cinerariifolium]